MGGEGIVHICGLWLNVLMGNEDLISEHVPIQHNCPWMMEAHDAAQVLGIFILITVVPAPFWEVARESLPSGFTNEKDEAGVLTSLRVPDS